MRRDMTATARGSRLLGVRFEPADVDLVLTRLGATAPETRDASGVETGAIRELKAALQTAVSEIRTLKRCHEESLSLIRAMLAAQPRHSGALRKEDPRAVDAASTVLLVDDDDETRTAAADCLEQAGYRVKTATSGSAALAAIAVEHPSAIVVELAIEGEIGGQTLLDVIRATMEWVRIPIVLYTNRVVGGAREARLHHAADEYVPKSGGPRALLQKVQDVLEETGARRSFVA